jgi:hypothetical protein
MLPATQMQALEFGDCVLPFGQLALQENELAIEYVFAAHGLHTDDPGEENVPGRHKLHDIALGSEKDPPGHWAQVDLLVTIPAGQPCKIMV